MSERKKGELRLEGDKPMEFIELSEGSIEAWSPAEEQSVNAIADTTRTYLRASRELANGKYDHLREHIPEYLTSPGNVLIAICPDGVVIRYERKQQEKGQIAAVLMREGLKHAASMLSQNLIHVQSPDTPRPPEEDFGVGFSITVDSPSRGMKRELDSGRIWFLVENVPQQRKLQPGAKPYSLLSVRNEFEIEVHGELDTDTSANLPGQRECQEFCV